MEISESPFSKIKKIILLTGIAPSVSLTRSRRSLTLAGFTMSSIAFLYRVENALAPTLFFPLVVAMFLAFFASRVAYEAEWYGLILLAELLELLSELSVMYFWWLFKDTLGIAQVSYFSLLGVIALILFTIKGFTDFYYMYRHLYLTDDSMVSE